MREVIPPAPPPPLPATTAAVATTTRRRSFFFHFFATDAIFLIHPCTYVRTYVSTYVCASIRVKFNPVWITLCAYQEQKLSRGFSSFFSNRIKRNKSETKRRIVVHHRNTKDAWDDIKAGSDNPLTSRRTDGGKNDQITSFKLCWHYQPSVFNWKARPLCFQFAYFASCSF